MPPIPTTLDQAWLNRQREKMQPYLDDYLEALRWAEVCDDPPILTAQNKLTERLHQIVDGVEMGISNGFINPPERKNHPICPIP